MPGEDAADAWRDLMREEPVLADGLREVKASLLWGSFPLPGGWRDQSEAFCSVASALMDIGLLDASRSAIQAGERHLRGIYEGANQILGSRG